MKNYYNLDKYMNDPDIIIAIPLINFVIIAGLTRNPQRFHILDPGFLNQVQDRLGRDDGIVAYLMSTFCKAS